MTINDKTIQQYRNIVTKINELRELLSEKLIKLGAINTDGSITTNNGLIITPSFSTLLTKATPEDIRSIINLNLPNKPIDTTLQFDTTNDIVNYLYTDNTKETTKIKDNTLTLSEINLLLINKFLFYHKYLSYELENMGIPKYDINQAKTIKKLILLLDRIERTKETKIIYNDTDNTIYINQDNILPIKVVDFYDEIPVTNGTINIYENNIKINTEPISIDDDIIVYPTTLGTHTYTIEYVPTTNHYLPSMETFILEALNPPLDGEISLHNITTTSRFYDANSVDDINGYKEDNWDINIKIYDNLKHSINKPIPFDIYLEDIYLFSGETDSLGNATLHNINIPYYNSDLIDLYYREVEQLEETIIYTDEELKRHLIFIKDITIDNDKRMTYTIIELNEEDYLDEINDCIKHLVIDNNCNLHYNKFYTDQHIKIKDVPDLREILNDMITEIYFDGEHLAYEVFGTKFYEVVNDHTSQSLTLILKTTLNDNNYPDTDILHAINLYHNPLYIDLPSLTWYKTDPNAPNEIIIRFCDENTGGFLRHLISAYELEINNNIINFNIGDEARYIYNIDHSSLNYGNNPFNLYLRDENNIPIASLNEKIIVLSNFEIPNENQFFLNDTPQIYYKPFGEPTLNKKVKINNTTYKTNENGLIKIIETWKNPTTYNLTLKAASDNLTEEKIYSYTLNKPFNISLLSQNNVQVKYKITIYDTEHITNVICNNESTQNIIYNNGLQHVNEHIVTINRNNTNIGNNILTVNTNDYEEKITFTFVEQLFQLQTPQTKVGFNQEIKIKSLDPSTSTINITGTGITQKSITKLNNVFTIICDVTQAFTLGTTLTITDGNNTETISIVILKGDIDADLKIDNSIVIAQSNKNDYLSFIGVAPTTENITLILNDGENNSSIQYPLTKTSNYTNIYNFKQTNKNAGTYTASVTFNGNNNYNSFILEQPYIILNNNTYVNNININNDDLLINDIKRGDIDNTNILTNIIIKNDDILITLETINKPEDNINNNIQTIDMNNNGDLVIDYGD